MDNLIVNKETDLELKKKELRALEAKQVPKKQYERMYSLAMFSKWFGRFCQLNSFVFAALGACAALWFSMGINSFTIMPLVIAFFVFVELGVSQSMSSFHAMRLDDIKISKIIYPIMFITLAISTPTTYYCTGSAIELLVPAPLLEDLAIVKEESDKLITQDTTYWYNQKVVCMASVADYWTVWKKKNEDRVSSARHIKEPFEDLKADVKAKQDSINKYLAYGQVRSEKAQIMAIASNAGKLAIHRNWCNKFGGILALASVGMILLLWPCRWYFEGWQRKYKVELGKIIAKEEKKDAQETVTETKTEQKKEKKTVIDNQAVKEKEQKEESIQIGFASTEQKIGVVMKEQDGTEYVLLRMTKGKNKGKIVKKDKTAIRNAVAGQSNQGSKRTILLKSILEQFK